MFSAEDLRPGKLTQTLLRQNSANNENEMANGTDPNGTNGTDTINNVDINSATEHANNTILSNSSIIDNVHQQYLNNHVSSVIEFLSNKIVSGLHSVGITFLDEYPLSMAIMILIFLSAKYIASFILESYTTTLGIIVLEPSERSFAQNNLRRFIRISLFSIMLYMLPAANNAKIYPYVNIVLLTMILYYLMLTVISAVNIAKTYIYQTYPYLSKTAVKWITSIINYIAVLIGITTIFSLWGINLGALLTGFGLIGIAVALGAQDFFKNVIAGILILAERRFEEGELVRIQDVTGVVEKVGFRTTLLIDLDKIPYYMPNSMFTDNAMQNLSRRPFRRIKMHIPIIKGISVYTFLELRRRLAAKIEGSYHFINEQGVNVFLQDFGDYDLKLEIICYSLPDWSDYMEAKNALFVIIKETLDELGLEFALPARVSISMNGSQETNLYRDPTNEFKS